VSEVSRAPAAFAAGVAFVGTFGWSRVRHVLGRTSDVAAESDGEPHTDDGDARAARDVDQASIYDAPRPEQPAEASFASAPPSPS